MTKRRGNLDSPAFSCIHRGICSILKKIYPDRMEGKQMKQLETPRLILRGFVMEDLDDFYSYAVTRMWEFMAAERRIKTGSKAPKN